VNSWSGAGPKLSRSAIETMWRQIERSERQSRNADVTVLPDLAPQADAMAHDLVPLSQLRPATGVTCG
jgi:hypothetical protein